jgi:hypothetical protein
MKTLKLALVESAHWLALFSLLGIVSAVRVAPAAAQEQVTVSGEVVDLSCYLAKGSKGNRHKACAQMCAKKGLPIGLLTDSGDTYLLLEDHDDPGPYDTAKGLAGDRAEVSGKKFSKGGVQSIEVTATKGL